MFGLRIVRTKDQPRPTHAPDGSLLTPARQLALMQAERAADDMMSAIRWAKRLAWLIVLIVMTVSYDHQRTYLRSIRVPDLGAVLIPFAFDAGTVLCVMVIGTTAMRQIAKNVALCVVLAPVAASAYINVRASASVAVAIVYVLVVGLIPAMELIKAFMGADFSTMTRIESEAFDSVSSRSREKLSPSRPLRGVSREEWEARKRAGYHRMTPAEKAAWTRARKQRVSRKTELAMPVSPAPAGPVRDLTPAEQARLTKV